MQRTATAKKKMPLSWGTVAATGALIAILAPTSEAIEELWMSQKPAETQYHFETKYFDQLASVSQGKT